MEKFVRLTGVAAPLPMINVDTDKVFPAQFMVTITRKGLGHRLFTRYRYNLDGTENPDFVLNKPPYRQTKILVTGENFGCGSSREHAPWSLLDFGIRCLIAPSFADIFFNNCFKNGILPIVLPQAQVDLLMEDARQGEHGATLTIDLENQEIVRPNGEKIPFDVNPFRKHCLLNGLDDVGLTLQEAGAIEAFERQHDRQQPWLSLRAAG